MKQTFRNPGPLYVPISAAQYGSHIQTYFHRAAFLLPSFPETVRKLV